MAYITRGRVGVAAQPLESLPSSFGASLGAAVREAWIGNPTQVLGDYLQFREANEFELRETDAPGLAETEGGAAVGFRRPGGERRLSLATIPDENRFTQDEAQQYFADQGVDLKAPPEGLSKRAAELLAERKRDEVERQSILARAPAGIGASGARLAAGLAVSVLDPLNVASAFVPVVGQARYAAMLGRAGTSGFARAGVRARVGAIEGAAGAAMLEPLVYAGRTQLQDDYGMTDSLLNLAFGTVLGGGLHVVGGRVADHFRGVQRALPDIESVPADAPIVAPEAIPSPVARQTRGLFATEPIAPFPRLADLTPERARALAVDELAADFRTELLAEAGGRAEPGAVAQLAAEAAALRNEIAEIQSDGWFRDTARQFQQERLSRKQAESQARRLREQEVGELQSRLERLEGQIDVNRRASQAEQDLAALDRGEVPERFGSAVDTRAAELQLQAALQTALPARHVSALAGPMAREHALRVAVAQAISGKVVDVEPILRGSPTPEILAAAHRQAAPESFAGVDVQASEAATARLNDDVARADMSAAQTDLDTAMQQLDAALQNLEQGGFDAQRIARMREELAVYDDMQADAKSLADATRAAALCGLRG
ncbi:MAG: hypothetical protein AB7E55_03185 [Pigmentiphaga sp.]